MSCGVCGCRLSPCRCDLPDERDFFKYGEMFMEIDPIRHTCRYEPPEKRVFPCEGCREELAVEAELQRSRHAVLRDWIELTTDQTIRDHVRMGRITADQGVDLLELRALLRWKRRPWWERAAVTLWRALWR